MQPFYSSLPPSPCWHRSSPWQTTFGKFLFGLKVVDRKLNRIDPFRGVVRLVVFCLSTAVFFITFFSNASLDSQLIHDRLSGSYVVKKGSM